MKKATIANARKAPSKAQRELRTLRRRLARLEATLADTRQSEQRYRLVAKTMNDGLIIVDKRMRMVLVNDRFCRMTGYRRSELLGKPGTMLLDPAAQKAAWGQLRKRMQGKAAPYELVFVRKDGRRVHWLVSPAPMHDAQGNFEASVSVVTDVSQFKRMEAALEAARDELERKVRLRTQELSRANESLQAEIRKKRQIVQELGESEEKYRQLFSNEIDAILVADAKTRQFVEVNDTACRMYGYTRQEFLRLRPQDISAQPLATVRAVRDVLRGVRTVVPLRLHRTRNGRVFPVELAFSSFALRGRQTILVVVRDITERQRAQENLRAARAKLMAHREEHRKGIARDLHDSVAQGLLVVDMKIKCIHAGVLAGESDRSKLAAMEDAAKCVRRLMGEVRQICRGLYPASLDVLGLYASLEQVALNWSRTGPKVKVLHDAAVTAARFSEDVEIGYYRIAQEAVANAIRHGKPTLVSIRLGYSRGTLRMRITDNGKGFAVKQSSGGLGMTSIRDRTDSLGATLQIDSRPGQTCLDVSVAAAPRAPKT